MRHREAPKSPRSGQHSRRGNARLPQPLGTHPYKNAEKGRGKAGSLDPLSLPVELQTALEALYGHYVKTFDLWIEQGIRVPPCFIVVCNNTSTSKLVYDYISGFQRENEDGTTTLVNGRLELFRNYDEHGNPIPRPRTLLIDSEQLEAGDALDDKFRVMAKDEVERFRREKVERTGDIQAAEKFTDEELLREVMNTVGKPDRLGESIRCVVSVSMLTEGWDANTVTHVLGVRAFGTQLLCEQVIGRALRRQSYEINEDGPNRGKFSVEYADVLGIPFDFNAKPVVAPPQPPRETIQVKAMRPERDHLEITFPRVQGYRVELPEERLEAKFTPDSVLELTPDLVGPSTTRNSGIIGEVVDLSLEHLGDMRQSTLVFQVTKRLLYTKWRDPGEEPKLHLFGQLKRITKEWLDNYLVCKGGTYPGLLMYQELADMACNKITTAITLKHKDTTRIKVIPDAYNPIGSTMHVKFNTSKKDRWETDARRCHINYVILDSDWEAEFCRVAESHPRVKAYVKNHNLGLEVPYLYGSENRKYRPDFIVLVDDGHGDEDPLHLIVEIKGYRREDAKEKKSTMETYWVPGVNNSAKYGRWAFAEFTEVYQIESDFRARIESEFDRMLEPYTDVSSQDPVSKYVFRVGSYVAKQFGNDPKWNRLATAVFRKIEAATDHAFHLSEIDATAETIKCDPSEALSLLALLSHEPEGVLRMELRSESQNGHEIPPSEFIHMLTAWWRKKTISEDEWQSWASKVHVRWMLNQ